jgi:hypothetical protein
MDRMKQYWKQIAAGLGISALGLFSYLMYKKLHSKKLAKGVSPLDFINFPLKKSEAMERSKVVKNVSYNLFLQFTDDSLITSANHYDGSTLIQFDLEKIPSNSSLFLDFVGSVKKISINGQEVSNIDHRDHRIYLPRDLLVEGGNRVEVFYVNHYSVNSSGIRNYNDPEDQGVKKIKF